MFQNHLGSRGRTEGDQTFMQMPFDAEDQQIAETANPTAENVERYSTPALEEEILDIGVGNKS